MTDLIDAKVAADAEEVEPIEPTALWAAGVFDRDNIEPDRAVAPAASGAQPLGKPDDLLSFAARDVRLGARRVVRVAADPCFHLDDDNGATVRREHDQVELASAHADVPAEPAEASSTEVPLRVPLTRSPDACGHRAAEASGP